MLNMFVIHVYRVVLWYRLRYTPVVYVGFVFLSNGCFPLPFGNLVQNLQDVKNKLDQARSVLTIAQDMQATYTNNKQSFDDFHKK